MDEDQQPDLYVEDQIAILPWNQLLSSMSNNGIKNYLRDDSKKYKDHFPLRLQEAMQAFNHVIGRLPKCDFQSSLRRLIDNKSLNKQHVGAQAKQLKEIEYYFSAYLRDIPQMLWEHGEYQFDLMLLTISMLEVVEFQVGVFELDGNIECMLQIFCLLSLREAPQELMLNSHHLEQLIFKLLDHYTLSERAWNVPSELLITLVCSQITHHKFVNGQQQHLDLLRKVLQCYKHAKAQQYKHRKQQIVLDQVEALQDEYIAFGLGALFQQRQQQRKKKAHAGQDVVVVVYMLIPESMQMMLMATMATFSSHYCDLDVNDKWELHLQTLRETSVFFVTLSFKILQALTVDERIRTKELVSNYQIVENLTKYARNHEYFTMSRECLRALTNLLYSPDGTLLWFKFDPPLNENSNYLRYVHGLELLLHGKPTGTPPGTPISMPIDFKVGDSIEIVGSSDDCEPGLHLPDQVSVSFWFVKQKQKRKLVPSVGTIHTLLASKDLPFVFTDAKYLMFGVCNVGDEERGKLIGMELQNVGIKFFDHIIKAGMQHVVITINNLTCECALFVNGVQKALLNGIYSHMWVQWVGNCSSGQENWGGVSDLRMYSKVLSGEEIAFLSSGQQHMLCNKGIQDARDYIDVVSQFGQNKILQEVRKLISENLATNPECCVVGLQCVSLLCHITRAMRMESAKTGMFELASTLVQSENTEISHFAKQVLMSVW